MERICHRADGEWTYPGALADYAERVGQLKGFERLSARESACAAALSRDELMQAYVARRFELQTHVIGDGVTIIAKPSLGLRNRLRLAWICLRGPRWPCQKDKA